MKKFKLFILLLLAIVVLLPAQAADRVDSKIRFNDLYGEVSIRPNDEDDDAYEYAEFDTIIYEDDRIRTKEDSGAVLGLEDMSTYVIKPESVIVIHTEKNNVSKLEMIAGGIWGNVKKMAEGKSIECEMSHCVAGLKGTVFKMSQSKDKMVNIIVVLRGLIEATLKDGKVIEVPAGHKLEIAKNIANLTEIDPNEIKELENEIEKDLEDMDGKLDEQKLNEKLLKQTADINDINSKFDANYKVLLEQSIAFYKARKLESLMNIAKQVDSLVLQASRYKGALKEAEATMTVAKKKLNKADNPALLKTSIDNCQKAINDCWATIGKIEQLILSWKDYVEELKKDFGSNDLDDHNKALDEKIGSVSNGAKTLIDSVTDGTSYSAIKDCIEGCERYLLELTSLASDVNDNKTSVVIKGKYTVAYNIIQKALKDFRTVPEIDNAMVRTLNDIDKTVPSFASDVRKNLAAYEPYSKLISKDTKAVEKYVRNVTGLLASYDRMRRNYTKANRMFTQIEKNFKGSAYKTSEYTDCKESWEKIEQAMTELDNEASELSSCVDNLKSQLESVLDNK